MSKRPARFEPGTRNLIITTEYTISVSERFKGVLEAGTQLAFMTLGGLIQFSDSTTAEIRTERNLEIQVGDDCVLFLRRAEERFGLSLGPQSMFTFHTRWHDAFQSAQFLRRVQEISGDAKRPVS